MDVFFGGGGLCFWHHFLKCTFKRFTSVSEHEDQRRFARGVADNEAHPDARLGFLTVCGFDAESTSASARFRIDGCCGEQSSFCRCTLLSPLTMALASQSCWVRLQPREEPPPFTVTQCPGPETDSPARPGWIMGSCNRLGRRTWCGECCFSSRQL